MKANIKFFSRFLFGIVFATLQAFSAQAQVWPQNGAILTQGFIDSIYGESQDFLQNLRPGNIALLLDGSKPGEYIEFKSEKLRSEKVPEFVTFIWTTSISPGISGAVAHYTLSVNGQSAMEFDSPGENDKRDWTKRKENGIELSFVFTRLWDNFKDHYGYMLLKVPSKLLKANQAQRFRIDQSNSKEGDLLMAFQDTVFNECHLFALPTLIKTEAGPKQLLQVECVHLGIPVECRVELDGLLLGKQLMYPGKNTFQYQIEPTLRTKVAKLTVNNSISSYVKSVSLKPVGLKEVYLLPHSHVDVGFTHVQDTVEKMQWQNFETGIELAKATAYYPVGAQSKWNVEVMWAVEGYLKQASPEKKAAFVEAVRKGWIGLDAVYGNMLTGIQKPEELIHNMSFANRFEKEYGIKTETAMISDVPGANWGYVTALAQNEIKYVSMGPNHMPHMPDLGYQVGNTLKTWGDIPFYWKSPSGKERVLCWMSRHGYSWFHPWLLGTLANSKGTAVLKFLDELEDEGYPYDMVQVRYTLGDNAGPDASLPDFVKNWNETHITPKFVIATNKEMFEAFEKKYAAVVPEFSGDFSPYWEDGTTSSAFETAMNRNNSERLVQAQALWAMQKQGLYPKSVFEKAWRNVVLFSEHTWGSYSSKSDPDGQLALDQWAVKQRFALDADSLVDGLIASLLSPLQNGAKYVDFVNTLSWERTELVRLLDYWDGKQIEIFDQNDRKIDAQKLTSGEWAFVAKNIPPQSQLRYRIKVKEKVASNSESRAVTSAFGDQKLRLKIDEKSGQLTSLRYRDVPFNMIDSVDQYGWDGYWYTGINAQNPKKAKSPKWSMSDNGTVVQKYITTSDAPGARSLTQEITYIAALDVIEIVNRVDKSKVLADENVRFSFPFNVPGSTIRMDQQWGMMQPGRDQLAGANQNFLCAQRWIDFSNNAGGLTWVSLDAPIVEFKEMHGQMWASDLKKRPWLDTFPHSTRLFSWVMDNVWFVNYKGYQEGKVDFRYLVKPHGKFDAATANRFAIEAAQPLLVGTIAANAKLISTYELEGDAAIITSSFKPADDGNGWVLRLWNCSDKSAKSTVKWSGSSDLLHYYLSNAKENLIQPIDARVELAAWETKTLRIVAQ